MRLRQMGPACNFQATGVYAQSTVVRTSSRPQRLASYKRLASRRRMRTPSTQHSTMSRATGFLALALLGAVCCQAAPRAEEVLAEGDYFAGRVQSLIDGDNLVASIEFEGRTFKSQRIRLWCTDAFELKQTCYDSHGKAWKCGEAALSLLREAAPVGSVVNCVVKQIPEVKGQIVAECKSTASNGSNINRELVLMGLAVPDRCVWCHAKSTAPEGRASGGRHIRCILLLVCSTSAGAFVGLPTMMSHPLLRSRSTALMRARSTCHGTSTRNCDGSTQPRAAIVSCLMLANLHPGPPRSHNACSTVETSNAAQICFQQHLWDKANSTES